MIATLTAILVWIVVPKDYTAFTKLSDEYKETELAVGLSVIQAHIKEVTGSADSGINDMEIYSKVLKSADFARCIAGKTVSGKGITYGAYLDEEDTIEAVQDAIVYNYIHSQETLSISFTDRDPVVASQMLDSVTVELQRIITRHRREIIAAALKNAEKEAGRTKKKYELALQRYAAFADSHTKVKTPTMKLQEQALEEELKNAHSFYRKATENYVRQEALSQRYQMAFAVIQDNTMPQTANNHLIGYILSFIILALMFTHIFVQYREERLQHIRLSQLGDFFSPWMLTISIWVLILGLYYLLDTGLYPITRQFYYSFLLWLPIFCLSALSAYVLTSDSSHGITTGGIAFNKAVFNFFLRHLTHHHAALCLSRVPDRDDVRHRRPDDQHPNTGRLWRRARHPELFGRHQSGIVCRGLVGSPQGSHVAGRHVGHRLPDELSGHHGEGTDLLCLRQLDVRTL